MNANVSLTLVEEGFDQSYIEKNTCCHFNPHCIF